MTLLSPSGKYIILKVRSIGIGDLLIGWIDTTFVSPNP